MASLKYFSTILVLSDTESDVEDAKEEEDEAPSRFNCAAKIVSNNFLAPSLTRSFESPNLSISTGHRIGRCFDGTRMLTNGGRIDRTRRL